jgi:hypothetical protein
MIQEVPIAIYIKDDNSLNSLPVSVEVVPHKAIIVIDNAVIIRRPNGIINKFSFICKRCVIFIFIITIMISIICVIASVNFIK